MPVWLGTVLDYEAPRNDPEHAGECIMDIMQEWKCDYEYWGNRTVNGREVYYAFANPSYESEAELHLNFEDNLRARAIGIMTSTRILRLPDRLIGGSYRDPMKTMSNSRMSGWLRNLTCIVVVC